MLLDSKKKGNFLWHPPHNAGREKNIPWDAVNEDLIDPELFSCPPLPGS